MKYAGTPFKAPCDDYYLANRSTIVNKKGGFRKAAGLLRLDWSGGIFVVTVLGRFTADGIRITAILIRTLTARAAGVAVLRFSDSKFTIEIPCDISSGQSYYCYDDEQFHI
jgi:hypothetical protein